LFQININGHSRISRQNQYNRNTDRECHSDRAHTSAEGKATSNTDQSVRSALRSRSLQKKFIISFVSLPKNYPSVKCIRGKTYNQSRDPVLRINPYSRFDGDSDHSVKVNHTVFLPNVRMSSKICPTPNVLAYHANMNKKLSCH